MDYLAAIQQVYNHLENDHVDKAVMVCLRIARNLQDFVYAAVFLREMYPNKRECERIFDDTHHLTEEAQTSIWKRSIEYWIDTHTLSFSIGKNDKGEEKDLFAIGVSEIDPELVQCERSIGDLQVPTGMGEYDTAAFTDRYSREKAGIRLRIRALQMVKEHVKTRCLNYAIRIERQLQAQSKSQSFLEAMHTEVNNYFKGQSEGVYSKLVKAAQLVDSNDPENLSLLLTEVGRAMKASADFFYQPKGESVKCADGLDRVLGDEQYMNRFQEFIAVTFDRSSSRDLLKAESEYLSVFARRLNDLASKGVHADVSPAEAKQGLLGHYMFLYNVTSRLQEQQPS